MKQRRHRMLKAWRKLPAVLQRFIATESMGAVSIGLLKVGDVFTIQAVYRKRRYGL